jgi:hypothetical protein
MSPKEGMLQLSILYTCWITICLHLYIFAVVRSPKQKHNELSEKEEALRLYHSAKEDKLDKPLLRQPSASPRQAIIDFTTTSTPKNHCPPLEPPPKPQKHEVSAKDQAHGASRRSAPANTLEKPLPRWQLKQVTQDFTKKLPPEITCTPPATPAMPRKVGLGAQLLSPKEGKISRPA